jgi:hypothetical protein
MLSYSTIINLRSKSLKAKHERFQINFTKPRLKVPKISPHAKVEHEKTLFPVDYRVLIEMLEDTDRIVYLQGLIGWTLT